MTDPVTTSLPSLGGSTLIGLFVALLGAEYGVNIAVIMAGVFGAFFALTASDATVTPKSEDGLPLIEWGTSTPKRNILLHACLMLILCATPGQRKGWLILIRGGMLSGFAANAIALYLKTKIGIEAYDVLLPVAFFLGMFSDQLPRLRDRVFGPKK